MSPSKPLRVAVLLSGSGTTLENLFVRQEAGTLPIQIVCVVSSRADAFGLERARRRGVPGTLVERKKHKDVETFSRMIFDAVRTHRPGLICLAGFMSLLRVPPDFQGRLMNIHPALLPAFGGKGYYGHHVHEAVLAHGCKVAGCTAHFVDNEYDHGPIILQKAIEVREDDTPDSLAERVQAAEREVFPEAVRLFAEGRLQLDGRRVRIR